MVRYGVYVMDGDKTMARYGRLERVYMRALDKADAIRDKWPGRRVVVRRLSGRTLLSKLLKGP